MGVGKIYRLGASPARNEKWGEWHGWERWQSHHIDMVYPRVKTLEGTQLAWSPGMGKKYGVGGAHHSP